MNVPDGNVQVEAVSHIAFIVRDLDRMSKFFCEGLGAREVYDSRAKNSSTSREKFFVLGGAWLAAAEGEPPSEKSYQHVAFKVNAADLPKFENSLRKLGVDIMPSRAPAQGAAESLYFYDFDNHLFELYSGTLEQRLQHYAQ